MFLNICGSAKPDEFVVNSIKFKKLNESEFNIGTYIALLTARPTI